MVQASTAINLTGEEINEAVKRVSQRWEEEDLPDTFQRVTRVRGRRIHVTIEHRETFPLGGRTYDVCVRAGASATSNLLAKKRLSVIDGMVSGPD